MSEMADLLSKNHSYRVRTPDECYWRFQWGDFVDYTGHHWGWQVYHFNVGEGKVRVGIWKEADVEQHLRLYGHKLDAEDWDDVRFWANLQWVTDIANTRLSDTLV